MRLSDVLNRAPDASLTEVENFLGPRRVGWGQHKLIDVGKVLQNSHCHVCGDLRTFVSSDKLSCLVAGDQLVSIDATLRCPGCDSTSESWFLVACDGDLFSAAPKVCLKRYTRNHQSGTAVPSSGAEQFEDLIQRAQLAFECGLGAGSMVYLRKILETITIEVASIAGISTSTPRGGRKPFRVLLEEVDRQHHVIPVQFAQDGYRLFSELSEAIHDAADEDMALIKYPPCKQLVSSVVINVKNNRDVAQAIEVLGWQVNEAAVYESES